MDEKLIMTPEVDELENASAANKKMIESILFGTAETIGIICEYRNLLKKVNDCKDKETFSLEVTKTKSLHSSRPSTPLQEEIQTSKYDFCFQPRHVAILLEKFIQLERLSMINISSFIFTIQDLIALSNESYGNEKGIYLPNAWLHLTLSHITKLSNLIMIQRGFINWKNFLIACMNITFPTQAEILNALAQFRTLDPDITNCVDKNKFDLVTLWFESMNPFVISQDMTTLRWRECIFQLFCDNFNFFQYIEFLLYFCKDVDPRIGMANSLTLLTGHFIPTDHLLEINLLKIDDELTVTDSELEMLFSDEDVLIAYDEADIELSVSQPMTQKVSLTRRMTILKERREQQHLRQVLEMEEEEEVMVQEEKIELEEHKIPTDHLTEEEETMSSAPHRRSKNLSGHSHIIRHSIEEKQHPKHFLEEHLETLEESHPKKSSLDEHKGHLSLHEHTTTFEISLEDGENEHQEGETEKEYEGEGEDDEEMNTLVSPTSDEGRDTSPKGNRKSNELVGSKQQQQREKKSKNKKNKRAESIANPEGKLKKDGSKSDKSNTNNNGGGKKKVGKKGQKQQNMSHEKTEISHSGSRTMRHSLSPDELASLHQIEFEEEEEQKNEEIENEEEHIIHEVKESDDLYHRDLIPLEAFLQSLWFGHITSYPIRNQSFLSKGFEKLKELAESIYEEQYMSSSGQDVDPHNAKFSIVLQHPFVKEILKRYKSFEIQDLTSMLQNVLTMPEDDIENFSDSASIPDSIPSIELSPLPLSPLLSAGTFIESFSQLFSCLSLNTAKDSTASIKSLMLDVNNNGSNTSAGMLLLGETSSINLKINEELDEVEEEETNNVLIETQNLTYDISNSIMDLEELKEGSMIEIIKTPDGLQSPKNFSSRTESIEDIDNEYNRSGFSLNQNQRNSLSPQNIKNQTSFHSLSQSQHSVVENVSFSNIPSVPLKNDVSVRKIENDIIPTSTSNQSIDIECLLESFHSKSYKSKKQKYSPMSFGLDPNLKSLLF